MPWSLSEARLAVVGARMRFGFVVAAATYAGLGLVDWFTGNRAAAYRELVGTLIILIGVWILRRAVSPVVRTVTTSVAALTISWVLASTAVLAGVFPSHSYVALIVGTGAVVPWGPVLQTAASILIAIVAVWNATHVSPTIVPPEREWVAFGVMIIGAIVLSYYNDGQQRITEAVDRMRQQRESHRRRRLANLEREVEERTAALAAEVEERRGAQQQLELLMNATPAYIAYFDANERYRWLNDNLCAVIGQPREALIGTSIRDAHPTFIWDRAAAAVARALAGEQVALEFELPINEHTFYIDLQYLAHTDETGQVLGVFMLARDVTEQRRREATRERTELLASLGTMAAGIAHEINNPAASILAAAELAESMLDDPNSKADLHSTLRVIAAEASRCGLIVRNVLGHVAAGPESPPMSKLSDIMERAATLLHDRVTQAGAQLSVELPPAASAIPMEESELIQVLVNLGTNALRAESTEIVLRAEVRDDRVALVVSDNGCGMSRDQVARAFDPFYTTHRAHGGVGLGLSLSHAIVTRHGGRIDVRSEVGKGTTMRVELPQRTAA